MNDKPATEVIRTVCGNNDGYSCGVCAHVEDGVITKITPGDFPDPSFRGTCEKGLSAHHWVYHPERLRYPLKRAGQRGEGKWQQVSWEEALDDISTQLKRVADEHDPKSIAWSVPDFPYLRQGGYLRLLSLTQGTLVHNAGFGDLAAPCADMVTFGSAMADHYASSPREPHLTIVWGSNPAETHYRRMREIMTAKKKGSKIITIDPRFTPTASRSDEHIEIRPGTDGALALGMIHVILDQELEDREFITEHTVGPLLVREDNGLFLREGDITGDAHKKGFMIWDEMNGRAQSADASQIKSALRGQYSVADIECRPAYELLAHMVKEYSPKKVSGITDVPEQTIYRLAVDYATRKPAAVHRGWGMQRTFHGDLAVRAINTLAAITGNMNLEKTPGFVLNKDAFVTPAGAPNPVPIMMLYDAVEKGEPFAVKALCFAGHNFANQLPHRNKIIQELFPQLEFILVIDLFMTATAKYADYVLPATSFFETTDLAVYPGIAEYALMPYLQLQQKVIEPLYQSRPDLRIVSELGRKMGFGEYFQKSEEEWLEEALSSGHPSMEGISLARLRKEPVRQKPSAPVRFSTPTGRIEFYVEKLKPFGQELPVYLEPVESVRRPKAKTYSLSLLTPHSKYRIHSTLANVDELLKHDPEPCLEIHPSDAELRNIRGGDAVMVYNERGRVILKAKPTPGIKQGVVAIAQGWWPEQYLEGHHNELTHDKINPAQKAILGPNAALCDVLVEVRKAEQGSLGD